MQFLSMFVACAERRLGSQLRHKTQRQLTESLFTAFSTYTLPFGACHRRWVRMAIAADVTATLDKIANYGFLGTHVVTLFVLYAVF